MFVAGAFTLIYVIKIMNENLQFFYINVEKLEQNNLLFYINLESL